MFLLQIQSAKKPLATDYGRRWGKEMKFSLGERIFSKANDIILGLFALSMLFPLVYVISASISAPWNVETGSVVFFPKNLTFESYKQILSDPNIWVAYGNSIFYTVFGTIVNLIFTISAAYPLAKKYFSGKKFINACIIFSMWFNVGLIPFYLNVKELGLYNTRAVIIFGFACSAFNIILLRSGFESVPVSLDEAARIDGASEFSIMTKIYLPISKATLAAIGLFYGVGRWNGYFWTMVLLKDDNKIPLQVLLKKLIVEASTSNEFSSFVSPESLTSSTTLVYTTIVVAMVPMLLVYPFIQKYFVKGVTLGAVKE